MIPLKRFIGVVLIGSLTLVPVYCLKCYQLDSGSVSRVDCQWGENFSDHWKGCFNHTVEGSTSVMGCATQDQRNKLPEGMREFEFLNGPNGENLPKNGKCMTAENQDNKLPGKLCLCDTDLCNSSADLPSRSMGLTWLFMAPLISAQLRPF